MEEKKLRVLAALAAELNESDILWAVGASAMLYFRGIVPEFHDIDLLDSLRMAEMLHGSRPNLTVMGMEPADYTSWSMELAGPC